MTISLFDMNYDEFHTRVYNIVKQLREENGMSYEEIELFWKNCINQARQQNAKAHQNIF